MTREQVKLLRDAIEASIITALEETEIGADGMFSKPKTASLRDKKWRLLEESCEDLTTESTENTEKTI